MMTQIEQTDVMVWSATAINTITNAVLEAGRGNRDGADALLKASLNHIHEARMVIVHGSGPQRKIG